MSKGELYDVLQRQVAAREEKLASLKERKIQEEREYLEHIAIEMDMQNVAEHAAHLSKQSAMLEAW
jgi:hypothetical protein